MKQYLLPNEIAEYTGSTQSIRNALLRKYGEHTSLGEKIKNVFDYPEDADTSIEELTSTLLDEQLKDVTPK